jgi:hypothetical protein
MATLTVKPKKVREDDHYCYFEAEFDTAPTTQEIAAAQVLAGFHPSGYGGPLDVIVKREGKVNYHVYWRCISSCE